MALLLMLVGCGADTSGEGTVEIPETGEEETSAAYFEESESPGTLVELEYDTYESMTYEEHSKVLHKRAIAHLPNDYSEEEKYNVFYLMHGGWSNLEDFSVLSGLFPLFYAVQRKSDV